MTDYLVDGSDLTSIANAIRTKGGTSASLEFPTEFVSAINAIPTGGGAVEEKQVNFIDYDGTILHSYTAQEANALTALPSNPSHTGLTAQGWNWTLAQIKTQLTNVPDGPVWVGQSYVTASGKTEIDIVLQGTRRSPYLALAPNGTLDVDWGDGSSHSTVTGSSLTTRKQTQHTYSAAGSYTITVSVTSGSFALYGSNTYSLLNNNSSTADANRVYGDAVKAVRIGNSAKIRQYGLGNLFSLRYVTIPTTGDPSGEGAFGTCSTLRSVTIPSGVTTLGTYAFSGNASTINVSLPSSITTIGNYAFNNNYSLTSVTIPSGVTAVNTYAFSNCRTLLGVWFSSTGVTFGTYAFNTCLALETAKLPSATTKINDYQFTTNTRLLNVTLPSSLTSITTNAFYGCTSLQKLTIPSGVTTIGASVFQNCYGMKEYHFQRTTPPSITSSTFTNIPSDCIIYVPYSADHSVLNAYKGASNWSSQSSKIQEEPAS